MKKLGFALLFTIVSNAYASDCLLATPITLDGPLLKTRYFNNLKTNEVPKFLNKNGYDPKKDNLAFRIFEIVLNGSPSLLGGAKMGPERKPAYIGFSNFYNGPTNIDGGLDVDIESGIKYYWSRVVTNYADAPGDAINELRLGIKGKKLVSIEFIHPVFEYIGEDGPYTYTQFTGENQKICVLSAKYVKD